MTTVGLKERCTIYRKDEHKYLILKLSLLKIHLLIFQTIIMKMIKYHVKIKIEKQKILSILNPANFRNIYYMDESSLNNCIMINECSSRKRSEKI